MNKGFYVLFLLVLLTVSNPIIAEPNQSDTVVFNEGGLAESELVRVSIVDYKLKEEDIGWAGSRITIKAHLIEAGRKRESYRGVREFYFAPHDHFITVECDIDGQRVKVHATLGARKNRRYELFCRPHYEKGVIDVRRKPKYRFNQLRAEVREINL